MGIIEAFICHCYGNKTCNNVDELRYSLFRTSINNSFRNLSSSKIGLFYHVLRSCFQAGWLWGNTFLQEKTPCVSEFGWDIVTGTLQIKYTDKFNQKTLHDVLITCKCRAVTNTMCKNCKCGKENVSNLDQCNCSRKCK